ncbi:hypothetical protein DFR30_2172 [Thiogranum longum]|uniref:Ferric reductase like protein n=1 Tax=Thiogranum longum TaxID=1537524 RepID=A0A4R1HAC7_9GAMM|nr:hypothetical protein [Thiogranum longum]TCK18887.1 hypothetical protein DFR30_2172 [Thiogranum longum]
MNKALKTTSLSINQATRVVPWLLWVCALVVGVSILFSVSESLITALTRATPPGQLLYVFSKLTGLLAIVLVWLQLMLSLSSRIFGRMVYAGSWIHRASGLALLLLLFLHAVLFVAAVSVRNGELSAGILVPDFTSGYYTSSVSLGILGLLLFGLGSGIYVLRQKRERLFRWGHRCVILACLLVFAHSYLIGSDTQSTLMRALYLLSSTFLLVALVVLYLKPFVMRRMQYD